MSFSIDSTPVNTRTEWRQAIRPTRGAARGFNAFPGVAHKFPQPVTNLPDDLIIIGFLEGTGASVAAALADLAADVWTRSEDAKSNTELTVDINGVRFTGMVLTRFATTGPIQSVAVSGSFKVIQAVVFGFMTTTTTAPAATP